MEWPLIPTHHFWKSLSSMKTQFFPRAKYKKGKFLSWKIFCYLMHLIFPPQIVFSNACIWFLEKNPLVTYLLPTCSVKERINKVSGLEIQKQKRFFSTIFHPSWKNPETFFNQETWENSRQSQLIEHKLNLGHILEQGKKSCNKKHIPN